MGSFITTIKNSFKKDNVISARSAYYKSRYGKDSTDDELLKEMVDDINESIKYKCNDNKYCAMFEISDDKERFIPTVVDKYKNAGYQVILIKNDTNLDGHSLSNLSSMFLILIWNNLKVIEKNTVTDNVEEAA